MEYEYKFLIMIFFSCTLCSYGLTIFHENAHEEIFKNYNCDNITMSLIPFNEKVTADCTGSEAWHLSRKESQSNVEAIGYQLYPIILSMFIVTMILGLVIIKKIEEK